MEEYSLTAEVIAGPEDLVGRKVPLTLTPLFDTDGGRTLFHSGFETPSLFLGREGLRRSFGDFEGIEKISQLHVDIVALEWGGFEVVYDDRRSVNPFLDLTLYEDDEPHETAEKMREKNEQSLRTKLTEIEVLSEKEVLVNFEGVITLRLEM